MPLIFDSILLLVISMKSMSVWTYLAEGIVASLGRD